MSTIIDYLDSYFNLDVKNPVKQNAEVNVVSSNVINGASIMNKLKMSPTEVLLETQTTMSRKLDLIEVLVSVLIAAVVIYCLHR